MADDITPQSSVIESDHSRSSEVALIEKFFNEAKKFDTASRDQKYSRKYHVTKDNIKEEKNNSFKWIPDQTKLKEEEKKRKTEKRMAHKPVEPTVSTLESDKTSSSCTASDFTSNVYSKNGYIRGNNDKKVGKESNSLLKNNELNSLVSTVGGTNTLPVEVKLEEKRPRKEEERRHWLDEENSIFIIWGGIQMMLGILMAVFGVLVIAHDSNLSGAGSGLWGGAVAMFSGKSKLSYDFVALNPNFYFTETASITLT